MFDEVIISKPDIWDVQIKTKNIQCPYKKFSGENGVGVYSCALNKKKCMKENCMKKMAEGK